MSHSTTPIWKRSLLPLYYYGSLPLRSLCGWRRNAAGRAPVTMLYYHRVADDSANSWTAGFRMFARQMYWLKRNFDMISLEEAQRRMRTGFNARPAVCITFDDGYSDNCQRAIPLLVAEKIPCTYFVTTRYVFDGLPFPHDLAHGDRFAPNTIAQLREMAAAGIEIGAHTRTHADLGQITDRQRLREEIVDAGAELQQALGRPVRYFAFPYGMPKNLNAEAFQIAYEAGYDAVCSAYGGYNFPGDDAFHLRRFHAGNAFLPLKNTVTLDPRKLLASSPYNYHVPETVAAEPVKALQS